MVQTGYALDSGSHYRLRLRSQTGPSEIVRSSAHRPIGRRPDGLAPGKPSPSA
jgi:hypothetical protein